MTEVVVEKEKTNRKLARVATIAQVRDIENADRIQHYRVDGWWVVDGKGKYQVGDKVIYCEIDSWIPHDIAPFLTKAASPPIFDGVPGNRLKTIKLRKALSQGLLLELPDELKDLEEGTDLTEKLGIIKYEKPTPANLRGLVRGNFPSWLKKTDQERIQNCFKDVQAVIEESDTANTWIVEEKLDGSSMTVGIQGDDVVVCSRNLSLKLDDENNSFVKAAHDCNIIEALKAYGKNIALQGELCGEGIQGNKYNITGTKWFIFDIWDVDNHKYLDYYKRKDVIFKLISLGAKLELVPHVNTMTLWNDKETLVDHLLDFAEGKSVLNSKQEREGLVFKNLDYPDVTFKVISNKFLLKGGDD